MKEPNFFIVGAAKSGTTSLYHYLLQHPDVCMSSLKEPHYFGEYRPPGPIIPDLQSYLGLFRGCDGCAAVGEASTAYLYSPSAAAEIRTTFPGAKIIIMLRNPVDRAYSLYWNHVRDGVEDRTFEKALEEEGDRIRAGWSFGYHYVRSGMYSVQVDRYLKGFGHENVKIFLFEDLKEDAGKTVTDCFRFLGLDAGYKVVTKKRHNPSGPHRFPLVARFLRSSSPLKRKIMASVPSTMKNKLKRDIRDINIGKVPPMDTGTRKYLIKIFSDDVEKLEKRVGRDLSDWVKC